MDTNVPNTELVLFNPQAVAETGNKMLMSIIATEMAREEAAGVIDRANKVENFIDVELTKAAIFLHNEQRVDLFDVYGNKQKSSVLYRGILTELGVLTRKITDDDKVEYEFTDPQLREQFYFDQKIANDAAHPDNQEHVRRRSQRNKLNIRLQRIVKAGIAMVDAGATIDDITYNDNEDGSRSPIITKGPKEVMGKSDRVQIHNTNMAPVEGASNTPTITGLAKVADAKHKAQPTSKADQESSTKKPGEGGTANTEEDFLAAANVLIRLVKGREGEFTAAEKTVMKNVLTELKNAGIK